jgi:GTPase
MSKTTVGKMRPEPTLVNISQILMKPEYVKPTMKLIFREGKVKAVGKII